jgi:predicted amidohydrolase
MAIAITYLEAHAGLPQDSVTLIGPDGADVFTYAKVHTCSWDAPEESLTGGNEFCVGDVPTRGDTAKVGAMICFDREFPESARMLMLNGAEVILRRMPANLTTLRPVSATSASHSFGRVLLRTPSE